MKLFNQTLSSKLAVVIVCLGINNAPCQNLIQDGGFESPQQTLPGVYNNVTPTGWTGGVRLFNGGQTLFPKPEQGNQYEGIEGSSLSQTFNVLNAGTYLFTWYGNSANGQFYSDQVSIKNGSSVIYTNFVSEFAQSNWTEHSALINLSAGADTLTFSGGSEENAHLLDNVSLVQVPELTNGLALFSMALLALGIFRVKREAK